jgi:hypothetical protein
MRVIIVTGKVSTVIVDQEVRMKRYICISVTVFALLLMSAISGQAEHSHGGGSHGGGWGGSGWGPVVGLGLGLGLWELSRPHYYPYPYYRYEDGPPVIIQQQAPDVYVQPAPQPTYWYYCQDPAGYYPYVKQCPKGWMKVVPSPPAE